jgi:hypothetical protein
MGMNGYLCALSAERHAELEAEPKRLFEVIGLKGGETTGVLDLDKAWDALDVLLSRRGEDRVLGDAVLARSGTPMKAAGAYGPAFYLPPARVARIAAVLGKLPAAHVRDRYGELHGKNVHGDYGQEICAPDEIKYIRDKVAAIQRAEIAALDASVAKLKAFYARAAKDGDGVMSLVT